MKTETSFKPGERPTGRKQGSKNKKTILKESIGLNTWEQVEVFLITEGAEKLIDSMRQLKPGQYVYAYTGLLEYFRPKLSRQQLSADLQDGTVEITMNLGNKA
jgi:Rps23 Pro-64 3,4-dihydroxylase Tpa1-like proline 4-hydroxylase